MFVPRRWGAGLVVAATLQLSLAAGAPAPPGGSCASYAAARPVGRTPPALKELSGLAASHRHPGIFWAHNDSGNALELFALRADGTVVAVFPLRGATATDPEDIAVGPCARDTPRPCVYLGDIGDNQARRVTVAILSVPEPATLRPTPLAATVRPFRYPDGPHNAEALVVEPQTGRLFVITKSLSGLGDVRRIDGLGPGRVGRAVSVGSLRLEGDFDALVTAADVHPDAGRLLVRTYGRVWEFRHPGARSVEALVGVAPVEVAGAVQPQGEAIAYRADGRGYLLGSEHAGSILFAVDCLETSADASRAAPGPTRPRGRGGPARASRP